MSFDARWASKVKEKCVTSHDGVKITYQSIGEGTGKVVALGHGLGARLYAWEPVLDALVPDYRVITWHYRGLYASETPKKIRHLSIPNHAEDLRRIMDAEKIEKLSIVGWSMGVQVGLEFAALYPERLDRLVLINGTYGHALETGFQPLFHLPYATYMLHEAIDALRNKEWLAKRVQAMASSQRIIEPLGTFYSRLRGNPQFKSVLRQYVNDVFGPSFKNYLRLFQELDAHSTYHNLKEINHPVLVIWGDLDFLTPAYLSRRMKRRLKNSQGYHRPLGTHFVHLEYPQKVPRRIKKYLDADVLKVTD